LPQKPEGLEGIRRTFVAELTDKQADIYVPAHNVSFGPELNGVYWGCHECYPKKPFFGIFAINQSLMSSLFT
jgi:hypothetical protein